MRTGLFLALLFVAFPVLAIEPADRDRAQKHFESGESLFESGNKEQALVEFQLAEAISPSNRNLFNIAQCEYHLGLLVDARSHYETFLKSEQTGQLADLARLRIDAINRRPGTLDITAIPDLVEVMIEGEGKKYQGQGPGRFRIPRGHYQVTVRKENHLSIIRKITIEVGESKSLLFKLEEIAAHLEIRTTPEDAVLYVQGNRTKNPYSQEVSAGQYEIYAEAPYHESKRAVFTLKPGERRVINLPLSYVQRSGRSELIGFWTGIGAAGVGLAVLTRGEPNTALSVPLFTAGVLAGGIGAAVLSTALAPAYIRDNRALFRIGTMWIGDVEGLTLGMALTQSWNWAWLSGAVGLGGGALSGWWLDRHAPNYGRVAMIQSASLFGLFTGALMVPAIEALPSKGPLNERTNDYTNKVRERVSWGMFAGLNLGLATGVALAYLPDQRQYGPSWQRVFLVDLAGVAGAFFSGVLEICTRKNIGAVGEKFCSAASSDPNLKLNDRTARFALVGTGVGLLAGWLLTFNYDKENRARDPEDRLPLLPLPSVVPVESASGGAALLPGVMARGRF